MSTRLTDDELARWAQWKRATESVMRSVAEAIAAETGLSSSDFSVLSRLVEQGGGRLRQQRLADDLGWERSRLSRHLGRMENRDLITREGNGPERWLTATPRGTGLLDSARAAHAVAVRSHLLHAIPSDDSKAFWAGVGMLAADR